MSARWVRIATVAAALAAFGAFASVVAAADGEVTISGFAYAPGTITVAEGDTVTWTNRDPVSHTATGMGFDAGRLAEGASASVTFELAGTFEYVCTFHPNMKGTVVVGAGTPGAGSGSVEGAVAQADAPATDSGPGGSDDATGPNLMAIALLALAGIAGFTTVARRRQRVRAPLIR